MQYIILLKTAWQDILNTSQQLHHQLRHSTAFGTVFYWSGEYDCLKWYYEPAKLDNFAIWFGIFLSSCFMQGYRLPFTWTTYLPTLFQAISGTAIMYRLYLFNPLCVWKECTYPMYAIPFHFTKISRKLNVISMITLYQIHQYIISWSVL